MPGPDVVAAWLENQRLESLRDYLERGRALADVPTAELSNRWLAIMWQWAKDFRAKIDHRPREDIESELHLRKTEPPFDKAKDLMDELRRKSREASDELVRDPDRLARAEHDIQERISKFEAAAQDAKAKPN